MVELIKLNTSHVRQERKGERKRGTLSFYDRLPLSMSRLARTILEHLPLTYRPHDVIGTKRFSAPMLTAQLPSKRWADCYCPSLGAIGRTRPFFIFKIPNSKAVSRFLPLNLRKFLPRCPVNDVLNFPRDRLNKLRGESLGILFPFQHFFQYSPL